MKKQVEKLVVLLGVAGAFVLMSFNEPRWFDKAVGEETYCGHGDFVKLSETQYSYYGYSGSLVHNTIYIYQSLRGSIRGVGIGFHQLVLK